MKPARREAYFSCLEITVEHSVNFIELLCRAVFGPYGRYTNFSNHFSGGVIIQPNIQNTYEARISSGPDGFLYIDNYNTETHESTRFQFFQSGKIELGLISYTGAWTAVAKILTDIDLKVINPTDKILQTSATTYPRASVFTDDQGGLFIRCYTDPHNYIELAVTKAGAYANKCVNDTVTSTVKFATFN